MLQTQDGSNRANTAVLFIHGFLGSPRQFQYLEPVVRSCGCDAYALLLPGHGGTLGDFVRVGRTQWQAYTLREVERLRAEYDNILLVGHSMGCLLAVQAALRDPSGIRGILALALPLYMRVSATGIQINWRYVTGRMRKQDERLKAAKEFCGVSGLFLWNAVRMLPRILDVLYMTRQSRAQIMKLRVPLSVVHSPGDEWVSRRTLAFAQKRLRDADIIQLSESGHFWYADADRQTIRNKLARLLERDGASISSN
ncbi:MAG: alpha/beta fold hydrolase [Bacillota bacterium]